MTAGPGERTLRLIPGGPDTEQDAEDAEDRIREELHRRGVGPGGPASSPPPMPAHPEAAETGQEPGGQGGTDEEDYVGLAAWLQAKRAALLKSPEPDDADDAEDAAPARAANDRLPHWWERDKPHVSGLGAADDEPGEEPAPDEEDGEDEEPALEPEGKRRGLRPAPKTSQRPPADDEQGDAEEAGEEHVPAGPRWSRPALGRPPGLPPKRQNLFTWWRSIETHNRWLLYHGTGLGAGVWAGVFSYGTRGAEFVTQQGLGDLEAEFTLGLLGLVLVVDYRVRNLFPPLAWFVRAISTSLVIGAAWNGTPLADLTN
ncbi:hypothetical protein [Streptomyces sp. NPDC086782]|uniref:hypothetical protein n=1 Tax=Streptomyces sp. NPDC086782 TaxID=3365757 RepID=UPI00382104E9